MTAEVVFTDDDLSDMQSRLDPKGMRPLVGLPLEKWRALLARLEAAEATIFMDGSSHYDELIEAWRKAAGK